MPNVRFNNGNLCLNDKSDSISSYFYIMTPIKNSLTHPSLKLVSLQHCLFEFLQLNDYFVPFKLYLNLRAYSALKTYKHEFVMMTTLSSCAC